MAQSDIFLVESVIVSCEIVVTFQDNEPLYSKHHILTGFNPPGWVGPGGLYMANSWRPSYMLACNNATSGYFCTLNKFGCNEYEDSFRSICEVVLKIASDMKHIN